MTEDERRERIEATASRDGSGAARAGRERRGSARPGPFVVRIRALAEEIGDADSITIEARDMALFKDLAAQMVLASAASAIDRAAGADDTPFAFRPTRGPTKH